MNKIQKLMLAISCFLPLYLILIFKNILALIKFGNQKDFSGCFIYNSVEAAIWFLLCVFGIIGIFCFSKLFLKSYNKAKEAIEIVSADNVTSEYYFTYFSLFVLTFFTVNPTSWIDFTILVVLMTLILVVYLRNEMYFINPILNLIGYKSFNIKYKNYNDTEITFEVKVFSKLNLGKTNGEDYFISYCAHDFTVCYDNIELQQYQQKRKEK